MLALQLGQCCYAALVCGAGVVDYSADPLLDITSPQCCSLSMLWLEGATSDMLTVILLPHSEHELIKAMHSIVCVDD